MRILKHLGMFFLLLAATATFAQPNQKKKAKIKALKIGFFTEHLDLTPAESEKFWPIYNKFEADKQSFGKKPSKPKIESMNDAELNQFLADQLDRQEQMLTLKRKLIQDLRPALPLRKIVKLEFVEKRFRRELLHRLGKKKGIKAREKADGNRKKAKNKNNLLKEGKSRSNLLKEGKSRRGTGELLN